MKKLIPTFFSIKLPIIFSEFNIIPYALLLFPTCDELTPLFYYVHKTIHLSNIYGLRLLYLYHIIL